MLLQSCYSFVFWLDKELVSVVDEKNVMGEVTARGKRMVKFGKSSYQANILAVGELSVLCRECAMSWL